MTYRQLILKYHPELLDLTVPGGIAGCPDVEIEGKDPSAFFCPAESERACRRCWDRKCPKDIVKKYEKEQEVYENPNE